MTGQPGTSNGATGLETQLRAAVSQRVGNARFGLWFGEGVSLGVYGDALEVGVPNAFFREWIQGHFAGNLLEAGAAVTGRPLRLTFRVDDEAEPRIGHVIEPTPDTERRADTVKIPLPPGVSPASFPTVHPLPPSDRPHLGGSTQRLARRLDDFVTGPCNRLAHAATSEMAATFGAGFNPLVVHAGVGLGKTHLLEGFSHAVRSRRPGTRLLHVTAEAFTNGFLDALRNGSLPSFRSRFRHAEALVIDDVHFISAKRATQDEFLHTFNALIADGVPVVLATDRHPRRINKLTDELATRFLGGMVVKIDAPDLATRRAILHAKALAKQVEVPGVVLDYIAEHLRASVRELEGALHSLIAHAVLSGKRLDINLARVALRDTIRHTVTAVGLRDVERVVCELFQIEPDALKSDSRSRASSYPRMLAMYLARKHANAAYSEIGRFFGGRNHSTVISAEKKVLSWLADERQSPPLAGFEAVADVLSTLEHALGT